MFRSRVLLLIVIAWSALAIAQQPADQDWSAPYEAALKSEFTLTQLTPDGLSVATPGTSVILEQDGFVLWAQVRKRWFIQTNTYSRGAINPGQSPEVLTRWEQMGQARSFRAGETLWLTDITFDRNGKGVTLQFLSEPYHGVRYVGKLKFPFAKESKPTPSQLLSTIVEVLQPRETPVKAEGSASVANNGGDAPQGEFRLLDRPAMDLLESSSVGAHLELLWMRQDPSLFEKDKTALQKFIEINNCGYAPNEPDLRTAVRRALSDEFQSASILDLYKSKAPVVLNLVSDKLIVRMRGYPTGGGRGNNFLLGRYDMTAKAFPFVDGNGTTVPSVSLSYAFLNPFGNCGNLFNVHYKIVFPPVVFNQLRMDEDAARAYVEGLAGGAQRDVIVTLEVQILPGAPKVETPLRPQESIEQMGMSEGTPTFDPRPTVTFSAKVTKATATSAPTPPYETQGRFLSVLYP